MISDFLKHKYVQGRLGIFSALLIALLLMTFHSQIAELFVETPEAPRVLANISDISGAVFRRNPNSPEGATLSNGYKVRHMDYIEAAENSYFTLTFAAGGAKLSFGSKDGAQTKLNGSIKIIVQRVPRQKEAPPHNLIHLISGNFSILERSPNDSELKIYHAGRQIDAGPTQPTKKEQTAPELKRSDIRKVMTEQRTLFDRCYASLLQSDPKAFGIVEMYFEIISTGQVKVANVHKAAVKNIVFEKCLVQSIKRARFSSFSGKTKKVIFPIEFGIN
ncbi:hypothetical protein COB52_04830 [Candidatus Kaiserbacteria bacterium]|nr:MAG: hypothetical protein COB52_04830 [Candidatus Kaiserbacteria bacterium]